MLTMRIGALCGVLLLIGGCGSVDASSAANGAVCPTSNQLVALAASDKPVLALALDDGYAYWTSGAATADAAPSGGAVMRVSFAGGAPEALAPDQPLPTDLAVDGQRAYWLDRFRGILSSVPVTGGSATVVARTGIASELTIDATYAYWLDSEATRTTLMRVPLAGGQPSVLVATLPLTRALAIDSKNAYWTDSDGLDDQGMGEKRLMQVPLAGGPTTTLFTTVPDSAFDAGSAFALDATSIYLFRSLPLTVGQSSYRSTLLKVPLSGGDPTTVTVTDTTGALPVAVGATVYWVEVDPYTGTSRVRKVSRDGGTPTVVASNLKRPATMKANGSKVCWSDSDTTYTVTCVDTCN
jgi:hypothetical protein